MRLFLLKIEYLMDLEVKMIDKGKWQPKKNLSQQELEEGRNNLIADLTLQGKFWGSRGALWLEKEFLRMWEFSIPRFEAPVGKYRTRNYRILLKMPAELFSAISSTYYAAGGNAGSRAEVSNLFLKLFWYWRAWRCLRAAERLSDKFVSFKKMEDMSLGELDVRACILNKRGRRNEAANLLSHGIMRILTNQTGTKHDLCLFLIHEAEVISSMRKYDKENKAEKNYQQAMELMEDEVAIPDLTRVRVLKSYGKFLAENKRINDAEDILEEALDLAKEKKLYDQERKIKAIFKSLKLIIR